MKTIAQALILIAVVTFTESLQAQNVKRRLFHFNIHTALGWGNSLRVTDSEIPIIGSYNLGLGVGVNIKKLTIGIGYDYRILTQFSDVTLDAGNRRGTFISPASFFFGFTHKAVSLGFMLVKNGTYSLSNTTAHATGAQKVVYTKPDGIKFHIAYNGKKRLKPFLYYEKINFKGMELDDVPTVATNYVEYTNYGLGVRYEF